MKEMKTIEKNAMSQIEEKKSKFIANVFYIENVDQVEEKIKEIKKKYYDARHHCYAYRIMQEDASIKEKSSDDGEPSGTAGAPMLNILKKNELSNVLVIVTRYFGGILLGTGGLVRAYSEATIKGLQEANIISQELGEEIEVVIEYKDLEKFKYYCNKRNIEIVDNNYKENIRCIIKTNEEEKTKLISENQKEINILNYTVLRRIYIKKKI